MNLMLRICPSCHEKLTTSEHYFCGNCGVILDSSLIQKIDTSKKIIDLNKVSLKKDHATAKTTFSQKAKAFIEITNAKGIAVLILVLLFIGIPTYILLSGIHTDLLYLTKPQNKLELITSTATPKETTTSIKTFPLVSASLGNPHLISFVPYYVDVYLESGDLQNSLKQLATHDEYYKELYESLAPNIKSAYSIYFINDSSGLKWLLITEVNENTEVLLPEKYSWLYSKIFDHTLLISNQPDLLKTSEVVKSGLEKNLQMNPNFVPVRSKVSTTGKMSLVAVTTLGKNFLAESAIKEIPQILTERVSSHFKEPNNYLVIN